MLDVINGITTTKIIKFGQLKRTPYIIKDIEIENVIKDIIFTILTLLIQSGFKVELMPIFNILLNNF